MQRSVGISSCKNFIEPKFIGGEAVSTGVRWSPIQRASSSALSPYVVRVGGGGSLRDRAAAQRRERNVFAVGDRVLAKFEASEEYFDGIIESVNTDQSFRVVFDDGDRDACVPRANILHAAAAVAVGGGDASSGGEEGRQQACAAALLTAQGCSSLPSLGSTAASQSAVQSKDGDGAGRELTQTICVGQRVLAKFEDSEEFFDGLVTQAHSDGTFRVEFDDGDVDDKVAAASILHPHSAKIILG